MRPPSDQVGPLSNQVGPLSNQVGPQSDKVGSLRPDGAPQTRWDPLRSGGAPSNLKGTPANLMEASPNPVGPPQLIRYFFLVGGPSTNFIQGAGWAWAGSAWKNPYIFKLIA